MIFKIGKFPVRKSLGSDGEKGCGGNHYEKSPVPRGGRGCALVPTARLVPSCLTGRHTLK